MRGRKNSVAAIDVGTTKVACVVADIGDYGETRILGVGVAPAAGMARGVIDNIQSARDAIQVAVQKCEQSCGMRILSATAAIAGGHIASQNNRGIIAISDRSRPISLDDRARVLDAAGEIALATNREVLHRIPRAFWIEGTEPVSDPVGMFGGRLDAEVHIISAAVSAIQNLAKCVEGAGVQVDDMVFTPIAAAQAVLEEQEQLQGVALVDVGASTTSLAVFESGAVAHSACLPLAGQILTQDLARVLRCPWESAERVKCDYGSASSSPSLNGQSVEIQAFGTNAHKQVSLGHVGEIIQARVEEILEMVMLEVKRAGYLDRVAAGLVLTGGTSQLKGLAEFAEARLDVPVRVGLPSVYSGLNDLIATPAYAAVLGMADAMLGDRDRAVHPGAFHYTDRPGNGLLRRLAAFGRALMPE